MLFADALSAPTRAVVGHTHLHLGTWTTIAMWLAVAALIVIAGRLANLLSICASASGDGRSPESCKALRETRG